jgi:calcineurin-like phosphoesterase family protein
MTVFFTSDTHFGHTNIIRYDPRPFAGVQEMNEALIKNWNSVVGPKDTVYHLGDVSILRPSSTKEILARLQGRICLIRGNHEKSAEHRLCRDRFEWIKDYHFLKLDGRVSIALMHYAMRVWDHSHHGAWHLFGHSHGHLSLPEGVFALDVG